MPFTWYEYQSILLVFIRITALIAVAPLFSDRRIPTILKVGLGVLLGILIIPVMDLAPSHYTSIPGFILAAGLEVLVGVVIGFVANLLFMGVQFSGQFMSLQMGFAAAQLFDPSTENNVPVIGEFYYIVAILIYMAIGGHGHLLEALQGSFTAVPLGGLVFHENFFEHLTRLTADVFVIALKIGAPIFITILLTEMALGLIARLVPQMNIFIFGFPLKILTGLLMIAISMPIFGRVFQALYQTSELNIYSIIGLIGP
ncbi:MAG: flagellar biosynthetic protein FliR [Candidatus Marinimicrobia bacterium]|nr:flagellar biosynthetic protein FliR [Candidatus Neomarinimicrobiota bacterium]MCF7880515.1 flagellar biosynthetic protein FliR [Candidatus Neomarinimicrobiota bacterium]